MKIKLYGAIITTLLFAVSVGISIMVLTWIDKLEKTACKCSEDFKRDYIKYYFYAYIGLYTLMYINTMYTIYSGGLGMGSSILSVIAKVIQYVLPAFALINMIFSIMYIWRLKEIDCKCSEDVRREIYYVLNWINIGFLGLGVAVVLFSAIVWAFAFGIAFANGVKVIDSTSNSFDKSSSSITRLSKSLRKNRSR